MAKNSIKKLTKRIWHSIVLGGIISIVFGLLAMFLPELTLASLVLMFGILLIIMGVIWLVESITSISTDPLWWLGLLFAVLGGGAGIYLLCNPSMTIKIFVVLLAVYVFVQSLIDFIIASYSEKTGDKWMWIILGIFGLIFGVAIVAHPMAASLTFVWVIGLYAVVRGVLSEVFAIRTREYLKKLAAKSTKGKKHKS
ncbi:MAG: DUF308 domain-containing protein [Candidatus Nomurabacteria bacterium]|jgi:uncharacterized membrane protein HdeD (DUF308 family)|nr:DUF308 domain-containing protein [Candidatus Nomurabacteria bacterium]